MYKYKLLVLTLFIGLGSCKKKEEPHCNYKGMIMFKTPENSTGAYVPYIDNKKQKAVNGGEFSIHDVDTGCYTLSVNNVSEVVCIKPCETAIFLIR